MTLSPTHFALEGVLLWVALSPTTKEMFQTRKGKVSLLLVNFFAILPDVDVIFSLHRGFSHSLVLPFILLILGVVMISIRDFIQENEWFDYAGKIAFFGALLWGIHILLDMQDPIAIFYPLSDRVYDIHFLIQLDILHPFLIFPYRLVGIIVDYGTVSLSKGLSYYFINLSISERRRIYGTKPVTLEIVDIILQLVIWILWILIVGRTLLSGVSLRSPFLQKFSQRAIPRLKHPLAVLGLSMILFGWMLGPMIGQEVREHSIYSGSIAVVERTIFAPAVYVSTETVGQLLQPRASHTVNATVYIPDSKENLSVVLILVKVDIITKFAQDALILFNSLSENSTSVDEANFVENYTNAREKLFSQSMLMTSNHEEGILQSFSDPGSYAVAVVLDHWTPFLLSGFSLSETVQIAVQLIYSRSVNFWVGVFLIGLGVIISLVPWSPLIHIEEVIGKKPDTHT